MPDEGAAAYDRAAAGAGDRGGGARTGRRVGWILYGILAGGTCLWAIASVVAALAHERPVRRQRPAIDPASRAQLLGCERELEALLADLHRRVFAVQSKALEEEVDLGRQWDPFVSVWRERWTEVGRHCRLGGGAPPGEAFARMTEVHEQLDELATAYRGLLTSFQDRYMDRLRRLRETLRETRRLLRERRRADPEGKET